MLKAAATYYLQFWASQQINRWTVLNTVHKPYQLSIFD